MTESMHRAFQRFIQKDTSAGIVLILVTLAALAMKNSVAGGLYDGFLHTPVSVQFGALAIAKPLVLWINDGLMAVFFLLIGLEVKRDRFLAAVLRHEIAGFAVDERAVGARIVASARLLHLDDPRAEVGQQQGAERPGQDAGQIDDSDAGERSEDGHEAAFLAELDPKG